MRKVGAAGYSDELRERIVQAVKSGKTIQAVADHYEVNRNTVRVYLNKAEEGTLAERIRPPGRPRIVQSEHKQQLLNQLGTHPDATLQEHACMLLEATGLKITYRTVDRVFQRHHITHKKTLVASERNEEQRAQFLNDLAPLLCPPARLVFLDECGFNTSLTRLYGRAPSNQRAVGRVPRNWGKNQTLICALQCSGPLAPLVVEGAVNGRRLSGMSARNSVRP